MHKISIQQTKNKILNKSSKVKMYTKLILSGSVVFDPRFGFLNPRSTTNKNFSKRVGFVRGRATMVRVKEGRWGYQIHDFNGQICDFGG